MHLSCFHNIVEHYEKGRSPQHGESNYGLNIIYVVCKKEATFNVLTLLKTESEWSNNDNFF